MFTSRAKKVVNYDADALEPADSEFLEIYAQYSSSGWFASFFILACVPPFCVNLLDSATAADRDIESTCLIPELINNKYWNLSALRNFTMPDAGRPCTYVTYNYSELYGKDPVDAYDWKQKVDEQEGNKLQVKSCTKNISLQYTWHNDSQTFVYTCYGSQYRDTARHFKMLTFGIGYIVFGSLSDLFGRKPLLIISMIFYGIGVVITPYVHTLYHLSTGYCMEALGGSGLLLLNYILFLELCHKKYRSVLMVYMEASEGVASLLGIVLKSSLQNHANLYHLFAIPSLLLLFYIYYMPESPRWYLSYGKKKKAWKLLHKWGGILPPSTFLPEISRNKYHILMENLQLIFTMKKYRRTVMVILYFKALKVTLLTNVKRFTKLKALTPASHKFVICISELGSYLCVLPPLYLFGKYLALYYMIICGSMCLFVSAFVKSMEHWYVLNMINAQYFNGLHIIMILYGNELLPTGVRGCSLGIIAGFGILLGKLGSFIMNITTNQLTLQKQEMYIYCVLQVIGIIMLTILPNVRIDELPDWKRYRKHA
ncbi:Sugar transporter [Popillia japonica]|uniref:Sugar transporter n=1 Tax=Popillia japonica TaxID=7064 RepID=A0AAW1MNP4_POPJA